MELRPADDQDQGRLRALYVAARRNEFAQAGLDAVAVQALLALQYEAQSLAYRQQFPDAQQYLLLQRQDAVGYLWLQRAPRVLRLLDISLLPDWRGQGLGSACLRQLQAQARAARLTLLLHVAEGNPARRLYERLGFTAGMQRGLHLEMSWHAERGESPSPSPRTVHPDWRPAP